MVSKKNTLNLVSMISSLVWTSIAVIAVCAASWLIFNPTLACADTIKADNSNAAIPRITYTLVLVYRTNAGEAVAITTIPNYGAEDDCMASQVFVRHRKYVDDSYCIRVSH